MAYQAAKSAWGSKSSFLTQAAKKGQDTNFNRTVKEITELLAPLNLNSQEEKKFKEEAEKLIHEQTRVLEEVQRYEKLDDVLSSINKNAGWITSYKNKEDHASVTKHQNEIRKILTDNAALFAATGDKGAKVKAEAEKHVGSSGGAAPALSQSDVTSVCNTASGITTWLKGWERLQDKKIAEYVAQGEALLKEKAAYFAFNADSQKAKAALEKEIDTCNKYLASVAPAAAPAPAAAAPASSVSSDDVRSLVNETSKITGWLRGWERMQDKKIAEYVEQGDKLIADKAALWNHNADTKKSKEELDKWLKTCKDYLATVNVPTTTATPAASSSAASSSAAVSKPAAGASSTNAGVNPQKFKDTMYSAKNSGDRALHSKQLDNALQYAGEVQKVLTESKSDLQSTPAGQAIFDEYSKWHETFMKKFNTTEEEVWWDQMRYELDSKLGSIDRMLNARNEGIFDEIKKVEVYLSTNQKWTDKFKAKNDWAGKLAKLKQTAETTYSTEKNAKEAAAKKEADDSAADKIRRENLHKEVQGKRQAFLATKKPVGFEITASEVGEYHFQFWHGNNEYKGDEYGEFYAQRQQDMVVGQKYVEPNQNPPFCYEGDTIEITLRFPMIPGIPKPAMHFTSPKVPTGTKKVVVKNMNFTFEK